MLTNLDHYKYPSLSLLPISCMYIIQSHIKTPHTHYTTLSQSMKLSPQDNPVMSAPTSATAKPLPLPSHTLSLLRSRLCSALRSALACTLVAAATLYSPPPIRSHLKFPAFAYVTSLLVVSDATLGDALSGAVLALYGTVLGLLPAMATFHIMQPQGMSAATAAIAVAISSFVVALSDSTGLIAKRVALGQIVIVYVTAFKEAAAGGGRVVLHPLPVGASTAAGALAAVVALVLPYPRLACFEVKEKSKMYTEITIERIRLFVGAFCADNKSCLAAYNSRAKYLTGTCNKLLSNIKLMKESTQWERPPFKFLPPYNKISWAKLQAIETSTKGMHLALASTSQSPLKTLDNQHLKEQISSLKDQTITRLTIQPNKSTETKSSHYSPLHVTLHDHLPSLFFLFSMNILLGGDETQIPPKTPKDTKIGTIRTMNITTEKVVIALKCSLCISLSVLFGILFSHANGYWSGLMVATAFTANRESTFKLATARAHGTALGSVYGLLGAFISQNLMAVRLLVLIPWIFFSSFLHRSRMYDQAGATAAAVSAIILLGRKNYGSPMIFSIQRLTEAYIGLCCSILVEIVLQPVRSSTMARGKLGESLRSLNECVESMINVDGLKEEEKKLVKRVNELKKCVEVGELEPNLWFLPFPVACYNKLCKSLSKIGDLLFFFDHGMEILRQEGCEIKGNVKGDLNKFKELVGGLVKSLEEVILVKSLDKLEKELKSKDGCDDIEVGGKGKVSPWANLSTLSVDEEEIEKVVCCFIQHSREVVEGIGIKEVNDEGRSQLVLCFGAIGFCMGELMREMREVEEGILELVQWENPSSDVNLYEITCKIKDVRT